MAGTHGGSVPHSTAGARWALAILLLALAIAAIGAVVVAAINGQTPLAVAIGVISAAFFSRVGC